MNLNKKALLILSVAHLVTDINQGALPALLPFFKEAMDLSYTTAGVILMATSLTSSLIQPVFGHLSDRRPLGWFLPLAPFIACLGLSLTGLVANYFLLLICAMVSGIGVASFHPEGFKTAYYFTGDKKATGMSLFSVGGNLGIAIGPIMALTIVSFFGLKGTLIHLILGVLIAIILFFNMSMLTSPVEFAHREAKKVKKSPLSRDQKISFSLLIIVATIRSWIQFGMATYIPFYYINYLKGNPLYAGKLVSTFLLSGVLGTVLGAILADRWGHKQILLLSLLLPFPFFILFYYSSGLMTFIFLGIAGMVLISTFALTTVMGQALLPQNLGMASGLMVGFTISAAGVGVTLLGVIADAWGVPVAIKTIFALPLIAFGVALLVKYPLHKEESAI